MHTRFVSPHLAHPTTDHALTALAGTPPKNTLLDYSPLYMNSEDTLIIMSELFMLCSTACEAQHERVFSLFIK